MYQYGSIDSYHSYTTEERLHKLWRERACCLDVEATIIVCFIDLMGERSAMHNSSYMVGYFRRYYLYIIWSRGKSFTHPQQVVAEVNNGLL